jgi:hypothetical protein
MGRAACTEPQCLYRGALYSLHSSTSLSFCQTAWRHIPEDGSFEALHRTTLQYRNNDISFRIANERRVNRIVIEPHSIQKKIMTWLNLISSSSSDEEFNPIMYKLHVRNTQNLRLTSQKHSASPLQRLAGPMNVTGPVTNTSLKTCG